MPESHWPGIPERLKQIARDDPEVKNEASVNSVNIGEKNPTSTLIKYYSSWTRLQRGVAWMLRFRDLLILLSQRKKSAKTDLSSSQTLVKSPTTKMNLPPITLKMHLSVEDIRRAERSVILFEQRCFFSQELALLEDGKRVKTSSSICKLDPLLEDGMRRRTNKQIGNASRPKKIQSYYPKVLTYLI